MLELARKPILFNYWKHHMLFLLGEIREKAKSPDHDFLKKQMKKIGSSTTDLYTGGMIIPDICSFCITQLKRIHRYRKDTYLRWIQQDPDEYKLMDFPDTSIWVLKIGIEEGRHIHIHPGRNVPHTLRVKANILKTAYLVNLFALHKKISPLNVDLINTVRNDILGLSPIKFVTMNHDLGKIIYLLGKQLGAFN